MSDIDLEQLAKLEEEYQVTRFEARHDDIICKVMDKLPALLAEVARLREMVEQAKPIVEAVAHIGVDFGCGKYEVEQKFIEPARELDTLMKGGA